MPSKKRVPTSKGKKASNCISSRQGRGKEHRKDSRCDRNKSRANVGHVEDEADRRRVTQSHFSSGEESKDGGGYYNNDDEEEDNVEMMKVARRLNDKSDDDSSDGEESKSDEDGPSQKRGEKHVISPNAVVGTGTTPAKEKHGPVSVSYTHLTLPTKA